VTANDWLSCADPDRLLDALRGRISPRQLRLFACACRRRVPAVRADEHLARAVEVIERCADGLAGRRALEAALAAAEAVEAEGTGPARAAARAVVASWSTAEHAASAAARAAPDPAAERTRQAGMLRDIVGDPFRPVPVDMAWLERHGGLVGSITRSIYDEGRFGDLPVLADALEDAGCAAAELLGHLRGPGPHVRGCWAVELVLSGRYC